MTIAGPVTVFGMRNCTYIWPVVMWPGCMTPPTAVPGLLDMVSWPLTKKLPSSASSKGPPREPAGAVADMVSSAKAEKAAQVPLMCRPVLFMTSSR
jgi:hypothetical protein